MELTTVEETIAIVLADIRTKSFSTIPPFEIGEVEERMKSFAAMNGITLGSDRIYMSAKQLQHSMRPSKSQKDLVVSEEELIHFPRNRFKMDLYFDGSCFIYTNGFSKFIVHPNYKLKIQRDIIQTVNYITATKVKDPAEFTLSKYAKIGTDR